MGPGARGRGERIPAPRHLAPPAPRRRARPWPILAATAVLAVGAAGVVAQRPSGAPSDAPTGTPVALADGDDIHVCTRAALRDRAGLVLVVGLPGVTDADDPLVDRLAEVGVGGVMLRDDNLTGREQARSLVDGLRERLGDHLLVAVDDEGGRVSAMRALGQSTTSARRLGQRGADASRAAGRALGDLAASVGIDWVLAPVADLDDGPAGGVIGDRSFGADPSGVAEVATAFADGLSEAGVAFTAKHFPGHGGIGDPHRGDTVDPRPLAELIADLTPFDALVDAGADAVMVGHVIYPSLGDEPASLEPAAYELLRARAFEAVAITDALGMGAVHARHGFDTAPALAVAAGADAVLVNQGDQVEVLLEGLVAAVDDGRLEEARLDQAITRVLALRGQPATGTACPA